MNFYGYTLQYEPNKKAMKYSKNAFVNKKMQLSKQITELYKQRWLPPEEMLGMSGYFLEMFVLFCAINIKAVHLAVRKNEVHVDN